MAIQIVKKLGAGFWGYVFLWLYWSIRYTIWLQGGASSHEAPNKAKQHRATSCAGQLFRGFATPNLPLLAALSRSIAMLQVTIFLAASFIAIYYSIWFLDPTKASAPRTATAMLIAFVIANVASFAGVPEEVWGSWVIPVMSIIVALWFVFRLNPVQLATVTGCYIAARLGAIALMNLLPLDVLYA